MKHYLFTLVGTLNITWHIVWGQKKNKGTPTPLQPFLDFKWFTALSPLNFYMFPEILLGHLHPRARKSNMAAVAMVR